MISQIVHTQLCLFLSADIFYGTTPSHTHLSCHTQKYGCATGFVKKYLRCAHCRLAKMHSFYTEIEKATQKSPAKPFLILWSVQSCRLSKIHKFARENIIVKGPHSTTFFSHCKLIFKTTHASNLPISRLFSYDLFRV